MILGRRRRLLQVRVVSPMPRRRRHLSRTTRSSPTDRQVVATLKQWEAGFQRASQALKDVHSRIADGLRSPAGRNVSDLLQRLDEANAIRLKGVGEATSVELLGESLRTSAISENPRHITAKG